ncbi:Rho GTPase-activating protein 24 [Choanephora cucurbitarum]|uniref:Rho GTPase-activating protein 24 n=1 Tax=Choanephora cucurbitarum TaxID=101091 RepID=A0A1C7N1S0_9FUNG|nr:Rho GTPase-activating protein 24 [Choanephora cucurbitarum]
MHQGFQMDLNPTSAASVNQNPKKRNKNPFTFLFTRQNKSTPTSSYHLDEDQHENLEGIFGAPLCDASKEGSSLWNLIVPDPVALCFHEISRRGLRTEGIFRLSGATCEVVALQKKINICTPEERKAIDASVYDVHTLASLVKKYLRELPEPVIPNGFHEQLQQVNLSDAREGIRQLSAILIKLPFHNRQLIHAILLMAVKIQLHVEKNMMCPEALATVFAPVCTGFEQSLRKDTMPKSSGTKAPNKKSYSTPTNTLNKKRYQKNAHLPFDFSALQLEPKPSIIEQHIKRNKHWTNIWKLMIEQHEVLIDTLSQQANQAKEKEQNPDATWKQHRTHYNMPSSTNTNQTLPSPFSTSGSTVLLPNDIIMAQFHPMHGYSQPETIRETVIPVAQPSTSNSHYANVQPYSQDLDLSEESCHAGDHSLVKKTSIFFQGSNTIRRILSASTLR